MNLPKEIQLIIPDFFQSMVLVKIYKLAKENKVIDVINSGSWNHGLEGAWEVI